MKYSGIIKKSRTIDLAVLNKVVDTSAAAFLLYSPEQLGITVPVYLLIRLILNGLAIYLRTQTSKPL